MSISPAGNIPWDPDLWVQFVRRAPGDLFLDGSPRPEIPSPVVYQLLGEIDKDQSAPELRYGVVRLAVEFGDRFASEDLSQLWRTIDHLGLHHPPPAPLSITARSAPRILVEMNDADRQTAARLIDQFRKESHTLSVGAAWRNLQSRITRHWNDYYRGRATTTPLDVPSGWWQTVVMRFSKLLAHHFRQTPDALTLSLLEALADQMYAELLAVRRFVNSQSPKWGEAVFRLSPQEFAEMMERYPPSIVDRVLECRHPKEMAERIVRDMGHPVRRRRPQKVVVDPSQDKLNGHPPPNPLPARGREVDAGIDAEFWQAVEAQAEARLTQMAVERTTRAAIAGPTLAVQGEDIPVWKDIPLLLREIREEQTLAATREESVRRTDKTHPVFGRLQKVWEAFNRSLPEPQISSRGWRYLTFAFARMTVGYVRRHSINDLVFDEALLSRMAEQIYQEALACRNELGLEEKWIPKVLRRISWTEIQALHIGRTPVEVRRILKSNTRGWLLTRIAKQRRRAVRSRRARYEPAGPIAEPAPFRYNPQISLRDNAQALAASSRGERIRNSHVRFANEARIRRAAEDFHRIIEKPLVSPDVWSGFIAQFARRAASAVGSEPVPDELFVEMARALYDEIEQLGRYPKTSTFPRRVLHGLTKLPATQIIRLYEIFPARFVREIVLDAARTAHIAENLLRLYETIHSRFALLEQFRDLPPRVFGRVTIRAFQVEDPIRFAGALLNVVAENYRHVRDYLARQGYERNVAETAAAETCTIARRSKREWIAMDLATKAQNRIRRSQRSEGGYADVAAFPAGLEAAVERLKNWERATRGESYPALHENLVRFGLNEPTTVWGRAVRYGPAEGIPGLIAVFAAPLVTQSVLGIDPRRNPGGFLAANLSTLHFLNAGGGAVSDVIRQARVMRQTQTAAQVAGRSVARESAVRVGPRIFTSNSLARTGLRSFGWRLRTMGGLPQGLVMAYPGFVLGSGAARLVSDHPLAEFAGGGAGAVGVPLGLRIWLGEAGMTRLLQSAPGRLIPGAGYAMLAHDVSTGVYETIQRWNLSDEAIARREQAIENLPWWDHYLTPLFAAVASVTNPPLANWTLQRREDRIQECIRIR